MVALESERVLGIAQVQHGTGGVDRAGDVARVEDI